MYENKWYTGGMRIKWLDWIAACMMVAWLAAGYIKIEYFDKTIGYTSVGAFVILGLLLYNHVNWMEAVKKKDWKLALIMAGIIIEVFNIFLSHSGFGVIFNITSLFLLLYLGEKVELPDGCYYLISMVCFCILIYWIGKGDNGYNTNMAAMVAMILAAGSMPGVEVWLTRHGKLKYYRFYMLAVAAIALWIAVENRARCVMIGIGMVYLLNLLIPKKVWKIKNVYRGAFVLLILVAVLFPIAYVHAWETGSIPVFVWMGKSSFSGRQIVWSQFFTAFQKEPLTGIGSDILAKIPDVAYSELHNGFLHVLVIHGVWIFLIFTILFFHAFWKKWDLVGEKTQIWCNICMITGLLTVSIFENYVFIPMYNIIWFLLMTRIYENEDRADENS